jgi:hypothetical protein
MQDTYSFQVVDGNRSQRSVLYELKRGIDAHLQKAPLPAKAG